MCCQQTQPKPDLIDELAPWLRLGVSAGATLVAFLISTGIGIYGLSQAESAATTAKEANRIASQANELANKLQKESQDFEREMEDLRQSMMTPRLTLLRFKRLSATHYIATVQNDGARQTAIFGVSLRPGEIGEMVGSTGQRPTMPESLRVPKIEVPFTDPAVLSIDLPIPAVVDGGDIVSIDIVMDGRFTTGSILVDQSVGEQLRVGRYEVQPRRPGNQTPDLGSDVDIFGDLGASVDELFGS